MTYHVTGVKTDGKRFKIVTDNVHHAMMINLFRGSVWKVYDDGQRVLLKRVSN